MGEELKPKIGQPIGNDETKGGTEGEKGTGKDTDTEGTKEGGRRTETGTKTGTKEKESPFMVTINEPGEEGIPKPDKPKKKRGPKPGSKNKNTNEDNSNLKENITLLLLTVFGLLSEKLHKCWEITQKEAESIADPLSKILAKLIPDETVGKYSDYVALFVALAMVVGPRIMLYSQVVKMERGPKLVREEGPTNTNNTGNTGVNKSSSNGGGNVKKLLANTIG